MSPYRGLAYTLICIDPFLVYRRYRPQVSINEPWTTRCACLAFRRRLFIEYQNLLLNQSSETQTKRERLAVPC